MLQKSDGVAGTLPTDGNQSSASGSPSSSSKCAQTKSTRRENAATNKSFPERTAAGDLFSATVGPGDPSPVRKYSSIIFIVASVITIEKIVMSELLSVEHTIWHFLGF